MAICYVDDTSVRRHTRPVMHWLLANAYVFLVTIIMTSWLSNAVQTQTTTYNKINVKNDVYKNGYRKLSCTSKIAKIHHFVRFVMYCFITTVLVAFYWARYDDSVRYKCDETVNFCGLRCATKSPITVFINVVFYIYICCFSFPCAWIKCL